MAICPNHGHPDLDLLLDGLDERRASNGLGLEPSELET